jgi:hypothetical protein
MMHSHKSLNSSSMTSPPPTPFGYVRRISQYTSFLFACMLILASCITSQVSTGEIHVLLAADTITNIRKSSRHDLANIKKALEALQQGAKIPVHIAECFDSSLSKDPIDTWISKTSVRPDDVLIFYFTGHGFRTKKNPTIWPSLYLASSGDLVDMNSVIEKIRKMPARLILIISDCCNNLVRQRKCLIAKSGPIPKASSSFLAIKAYKKLFLETEGIIIASGAVPGEVAWATDRGGIFTNCLLDSLESEIHKPDPQWDRIFNRSKVLCGKLQRPQYHIDVRPCSN